MEQQNKESGLIIDPPNELRFCGPFNRPVVTLMKLTNPTDEEFLFKIKTTAPKRYCVRPNFGNVPPHDYAQVEICLQPFVYDPNEKNKHKFMVQSLMAPAGGLVGCDDLNKLWKESNGMLIDAKLKCVFEMPTVSSTADTSGSAKPEKAIKDVSKKDEEEKISNLLSSEKSEPMVIELMQLRDDNNDLRKENINLKEQVARLRYSSKPPMDEPYTPMVAEKQIPMFYIAISIAAAVFGLLLGKYLL